MADQHTGGCGGFIFRHRVEMVKEPRSVVPCSARSISSSRSARPALVAEARLDKADGVPARPRSTNRARQASQVARPPHASSRIAAWWLHRRGRRRESSGKVKGLARGWLGPGRGTSRAPRHIEVRPLRQHARDQHRSPANGPPAPRRDCPGWRRSPRPPRPGDGGCARRSAGPSRPLGHCPATIANAARAVEAGDDQGRDRHGSPHSAGRRRPGLKTGGRERSASALLAGGAARIAKIRVMGHLSHQLRI